MILNEEDGLTQHLEQTLSGMYRACQDEEQEVIENVRCRLLVWLCE